MPTALPVSFIPPAQKAAAARPVVSEATAPVQGRATQVVNPSSSQMDFLQQLAGVALQYGAPVEPGQLPAQQAAVLKAWTTNAGSSYSEYMLDQGLSTAAQNPTALASLAAGSTQAALSAADVQGSLKALGLSAQEWDSYQKLYQQQQAREASELGSFMKIAGAVIGGVVGTFIEPGGGTLIGAELGGKLGGAVGGAAGD